MTEPQDVSAEKVNGKARKPTMRGIILWSAGILLALLLAWLIGTVAVPVWQTRSAVLYCTSDQTPSEANDWEGGLARLGGPDRALPRLQAYLRMPDFLAPEKSNAVILLGYCGRRAVPVLVSRLEHPEALMRIAAAEALCEIGPAAQAAVPALKSALDDPDDSVRQAAAGALKWIRGEPQKDKTGRNN